MQIRLLTVLIAVSLLTANCSSPTAVKGPIGGGRASGATATSTHAGPTGPAGSIGVASYYAASGLTAAHRTLPFGTRVRVTNTSNGRSVVVRISDRGPFIRGRSIDLSHSAAQAVGMTEMGLAQVRMEVLQ
jgi:peptidoglycan lytic transglycosylase